MSTATIADLTDAETRQRLADIAVGEQPEPGPEPDESVRDGHDSQGDAGSRGAKRKRTRDRKRTRSSSTSSRDRERTRYRGNLRDPLTQTLTMIGATVAMFDPFDGAVIIGQAEAVARQLEEAATANPRIKRALESMLAGGTGIFAIGVGLMPVVLPILWNHGLVPDMPMITKMAPDGTLPMSRRRDQDGNPVAPADQPQGPDLAGLFAAAINGANIDPDNVSVGVDGADSPPDGEG